MSVDVKTPTKTQFEHAEFPCGDKKPGIPTVTVSVTGSGGGPPVAAHHTARPIFQRQTSENVGNKYTRKRRFSERAGGADNRERYIGAPGFKRNRFGRGGKWGNFGGQERIVLPTKFFLGGNINDPLNLNSLSDESINRALNENTPKSSPLAVPRHRREVTVIIPANIQDPLGLTSGEDLLLLSPKSAGKKRQRKNKHKKKNQGDKSDVTDTTLEGSHFSLLTDSKDYSKPMHIDITSDSEVNYSQQNLSTEGGLALSSSDPLHTPSVDPGAGHNSNITSSGDGAGHAKRNDSTSSSTGTLVPQIMSPKCKRRKRNSSECKSDGSQSQRASIDSEKSTKSDKNSPHRPKYLKRQHSHSSSTQSGPYIPPPNRSAKSKPRGRKHSKQFIYGNYNRYYGYRNPDGSEKDSRVGNFNRTWFEGKDVLDIGCNVGHVTLGIAKDLGPRKVVGMDIDGTLVAAAKRNVRHYLTTKVANTAKYPASMVASFGPIAAPPVAVTGEDTGLTFPNNVMFLTGNYVLESDELVDMTREEYDVILALSVTKWVHLNWGDAGLKRMFRRMFKQLRPGGKLILEPQLWPSYKKRKKLTEAHSMNYAQIQLRPEQFREYLLREIGFSKCEGLEVPFNKAKGFQRPLLVFSKSDTTQPGSRVTTPGRSDTCSRGATPRFQLGWSATTSPATFDGMSNPATPGYIDSPRCAEKYTPRTELLEAVEEESLIVTPPIAESTPIGIGQRPLSSLRANSAPCLLETSGLHTSVYSVCVSEQKTSVVTKTVEFEENVDGQIKESLDAPTKESVDAQTKESVDGQAKESLDAQTKESVDAQTKESLDAQTKESVDAQTKESVDAQTKESVDAQTKESVDGQAKESVDAQTKESVDAQTKESVDAQTKESVDGHAKESVDGQAKESVDAQTKESVDGQAKESLDAQTKESVDVQTKESVDGHAKESLDAQTKESVDAQTKESVDGQAKESLDAQAKESVDGQAKESLDGQAKESVDVDGQKDQGAERENSTKAIGDNCDQKDLDVSSSDIQHRDSGSLDTNNDNGSSNQQLGHSTDARVRDTTATSSSPLPEPGSKDDVELTDPSRSDEKTLTETSTRDCTQKGMSE